MITLNEQFTDREDNGEQDDDSSLNSNDSQNRFESHNENDTEDRNVFMTGHVCSSEICCVCI